jgi:hypothetical protein
LQTEPDIDMAKLVVNKVLTDASIGKYDVTIGEGTFNESIQIVLGAPLLRESGNCGRREGIGMKAWGKLKLLLMVVSEGGD